MLVSERTGTHNRFQYHTVQLLYIIDGWLSSDVNNTNNNAMDDGVQMDAMEWSNKHNTAIPYA